MICINFVIRNEYLLGNHPPILKENVRDQQLDKVTILGFNGGIWIWNFGLYPG